MIIRSIDITERIVNLFNKDMKEEDYCTIGFIVCNTCYVDYTKFNKGKVLFSESLEDENLLGVFIVFQIINRYEYLYIIENMNYEGKFKTLEADKIYVWKDKEFLDKIDFDELYAEDIELFNLYR